MAATRLTEARITALLPRKTTRNIRAEASLSDVRLHDLRNVSLGVIQGTPLCRLCRACLDIRSQP